MKKILFGFILGVVFSSFHAQMRLPEKFKSFTKTAGQSLAEINKMVKELS